MWNMSRQIVLMTLSWLCLLSLTLGHLLPRSIRNSVMREVGRVGGMGTTAAAIIAGSPAIAQASQGKYEYQPALEGLDYGKPRTYYPSKCAMARKEGRSMVPTLTTSVGKLDLGLP